MAKKARKPAPNKARAPKKAKPVRAKKPPTQRKTSNSKRGEKIKGPKQPQLPGTSGVRSAKLDTVCEGIGDERRTKNAANLEEKSLVANALKIMQSRKIQVYKHAGVELAMMPGTATLRVRLTKQDGDASVIGGETSSDNAGEPHGGEPGDGETEGGDLDDLDGGAPDGEGD